MFWVFLFENFRVDWIFAVRLKDDFDGLFGQSFRPCSKNRKLRDKSAFVYWKDIKWVTHTVGQFFQSVCTLEFQAYGHGNFYQYSEAIQDEGDIQKKGQCSQTKK